MSTNNTFNDMDEAQGHILELIGNLEDKGKIDDATIRDLKEKVDYLFGETFKDMTTIQGMYSHEEILEIVNTQEWSKPEPNKY